MFFTEINMHSEQLEQLLPNDFMAETYSASIAISAIYENIC